MSLGKIERGFRRKSSTCPEFAWAAPSFRAEGLSERAQEIFGIKAVAHTGDEAHILLGDAAQIQKVRPLRPRMLAKNSSRPRLVRSDTALPWTGPDGATGFAPPIGRPIPAGSARPPRRRFFSGPGNSIVVTGVPARFGNRDGGPGGCRGGSGYRLRGLRRRRLRLFLLHDIDAALEIRAILYDDARRPYVAE